MAASKLIPPSNWSGMTYMEIIWMLVKAVEERANVAAGDRFIFRTVESHRYDYLYYLKFICYNLRRILDRTTVGYINPAKDPRLVSMPDNSKVSDIIWNMADILADIGAPSFFDFATNGRIGAPSPINGMTTGFKDGETNPPYLVQYYEMIIRMKEVLIEFRIPLSGNPWVEENLITETSRQSREVTTQLQGIYSSRFCWQDTTGLDGAGISISGRLEETRCDGPENISGHDSEWNTGYKTSILDGAAIDDLPNICRTRAESRAFRVQDTKAFGIWDNEIIDHFKSAQDIELNRIFITLDYQNFSKGNLNLISGRPRNVSAFSFISHYPDGDLSSPYSEGFNFDDLGVVSWGATNRYIGGYLNQPSPPDLAVTLSPSTPYLTYQQSPYYENGTCIGVEHGWSYEWRDHVIYEDWDYEGGFEYYS